MKPEGELVFRDGDAQGIIRFLSPQLLATYMTGEARESVVLWYIRIFHEFVDSAPLKVDIFHDWGGVTGLTSEARRTFTNWVNSRATRNRAAVRCAHTLVESTLIYLALGTVNSFGPKGYAIAYRDRGKFEHARNLALLSPSTERIHRTIAHG